MDLHQRTLRIGLMAILCAVVFRLCSLDFGALVNRILSNEDILAFLIYLETGRDVRFSPSLDAFSPSFVESPPPETAAPPEPVIPFFSDPEQIELYYACNVDPDIPSLLSRPLQWDLFGEAPTVLILHTHTTESYTRHTEKYEETAAYRTLDENFNMLSIGAELTRILTEQGITALQDRQVHDYPSYNGSYVHARAAIRDYLEQYPSIRLVLDLHRDASEGTSGQLRTLSLVEGEKSAQLMVVLGTNHKGYEENLSLGLKLHAQLETQSPGIVRPLQLRGQRFNQDLLPGTLLIEVGAAGNSHKEAMLAAQQLAKAIIALAKGTQ